MVVLLNIIYFFIKEIITNLWAVYNIAQHSFPFWLHVCVLGMLMYPASSDIITQRFNFLSPPVCTDLAGRGSAPPN